MIKKIKNTNAITLVALVVTIIVLIILAGISINLVLGQNGVITKARDARERTLLGKEEEAAKLTFTDVQMELTQGRTVDSETFQKMIDGNFGSENATGIIGEGSYIITVARSGTNYQMDSNGNIGELEKLPIDFNPGVLEGSGNTYTINSIEDLVAFAYSINKGEETYNNKNITLGLNLDMQNDASYMDPTTKYKLTDYGYEKSEDDTGTAIKTLLTDTTGIGFVPIGKTYDTRFLGNFDGLYHSIGNLYIKDTQNGRNNTGLFGAVGTGEFRNLGLISPNITGNGFVRRYNRILSSRSYNYKLLC